MSLQRSFLPSPLGDEVVRADLALTPLHQVLEFKLGMIITRAHESVSAVRLDRREARDLGCGAASRVRVRARLVRRRRRAGRLRSGLHPGRPLPDHPRASLRRSDVMKIVVIIKQVPDTATQVKIAATGSDRHHGHHVDRLALRRVRRGGGAPDQGEARPGRGRGGFPRPGSREGGAALLPRDGRDRAIHLNDPAWSSGGHPGDRGRWPP